MQQQEHKDARAHLAKKAAWWKYHKENPAVWHEFCRLAGLAIAAGRTSYSPWVIINLIRWNHEIVTKSGDFKISNDYIAFYSRLFHREFPEHDGFFTTKQMKGEL